MGRVLRSTKWQASVGLKPSSNGESNSKRFFPRIGSFLSTELSYKQTTLFLGFVLAAVLFYGFFWQVLDYSVSWVHPELPGRMLDVAARNGAGFHWKDLTLCFDWKKMDQDPQPRFLSYLFTVLDTKFRLWLFSFVPPHPTFCLTWLLFAVGAPLLMYRVTKSFTQDKATALMATALFCLTTGYLSSVTFRFHPAKPLTMLFILSLLFIGTKLKEQEEVEFSKKTQAAAFFGFTTFIFVGLFSDPTAFFAYLAMPILFPSLVRRFGKYWFLWSAFAVSGVLFLVSVTYLIPPLVHRLGYEDFTFWKFAITDNQNLTLSFDYPFGKIANSLLEAHLLLISDSGFEFLTAGILLFFGYSWAKLSRESRTSVLLLIGALVALVIFQTVIHSRHMPGQPISGYYYGSLFSILVVIPIAILLSRHSEVAWAGRYTVFLYLLYCLASNFSYIQNYWIEGHKDSRIHNSSPLTYDIVKETWEHRDDDAYFAQHPVTELPNDSRWLLWNMAHERSHPLN